MFRTVIEQLETPFEPSGSPKLRRVGKFIEMLLFSYQSFPHGLVGPAKVLLRPANDMESNFALDIFVHPTIFAATETELASHQEIELNCSRRNPHLKLFRLAGPKAESLVVRALLTVDASSTSKTSPRQATSLDDNFLYEFNHKSSQCFVGYLDTPDSATLKRPSAFRRALYVIGDMWSVDVSKQMSALTEHNKLWQQLVLCSAGAGARVIGLSELEAIATAEGTLCCCTNQ